MGEDRAGRIYAPGIAELGGDPDRLLLVETGDSKALLACASDAIRCAGSAAVIVESWNRAFPAGGPLGLVGWQAAFLAVGIPGLLLALLGEVPRLGGRVCVRGGMCECAMVREADGEVRTWTGLRTIYDDVRMTPVCQ